MIDVALDVNVNSEVHTITWPISMITDCHVGVLYKSACDFFFFVFVIF